MVRRIEREPDLSQMMAEQIQMETNSDLRRVPLMVGLRKKGSNWNWLMAVLIQTEQS